MAQRITLVDPYFVAVVNTGGLGVDVTETTLHAGEDLANDLQKVEQRFNYYQFSTAGIATIKSGAGFLHSLVVTGVVGSGQLILYDNTSLGGNIIANVLNSSTGGTYLPLPTALLDVSFTLGLTGSSITNYLYTISYR